ncbi:hypothetical protein LINPERPRIM_LOCUS5006 [Linum perenne]
MKLCIQTDSRAAVAILEDTDLRCHRHSSLVDPFCVLKSQDWKVSIHHIYREDNNANDYLVNFGHHLELETHVFPFPDNSLLYWLRFDLVGASLSWLVNNTS